MCSQSVNALLRCSIKRSTLIASSSLEAPLPRAGWTEYVVQVLIASIHISLSRSKGPKVTIIGTTGGSGCGVRITCVHRVLMLCSGALLKGVP